MKTEEQKVDRAWRNLRPGYNRVWLTADDIAAIQALRDRGSITTKRPPHIVLGAALAMNLADRVAASVAVRQDPSTLNPQPSTSTQVPS
jgi:hypothetical protein